MEPATNAIRDTEGQGLEPSDWTGIVMSVLRQWHQVDGDWYVAQLAEPEIQAFTVESVDTTVADFRNALAAVNGTSDAFARAIINPMTRDLAGNLAAQRGSDTAEVHYWLAASSRGQGLASKALAETVDWIRTNWTSISRVCLHIRSGNDASVRVAERVGFVRDLSRDKTIQVRGEDWLMTGYTLQLPSRPSCD